MSDPNKPQMTLWVWPTGLCPRRLIYYFKAKSLPSSTLQTLTLVPVTLDPSAGALVSQPTHELRPPGTSLPTLRTTTTAAAAHPEYIYQSSSILEYLEDTHPEPPLSGTTALHRARVRDVTQLVNEAQVWAEVYIRHGHAGSLAWSGMAAAQQSSDAAADALAKWRAAMARLESWVRADVVERGARSIAGGNDPTLADFTLMAVCTYIPEIYGWDVLEGCEVLRKWCERAKELGWFVERSALERMERGGLDELFV